MADKKSALPGLPPVEDEVLNFESLAVAEDQHSNSELDDGFLAYTVSDDAGEGKLRNILRRTNPY